MSRFNRNQDRKYGRGRNEPQLPGRKFPERWDHYDNVGRDIEGTRFVPFKTPLDPSFFHGKDYPLELQFGVQALIKMATKAKKIIGLVIDLTNTDKYYKKTEWANHGVQYRKLYCPGHEVNAREDLVEDFIQIVKTFVEDSSNDGKLIGVHCTHGLNRTGYLICRYLIDVDNYSAADAISMFEFYRGHEIEREKYKQSLYEAEIRRNRMGAGDQEASSSEPTPQNPESLPSATKEDVLVAQEAAATN